MFMVRRFSLLVNVITFLNSPKYERSLKGLTALRSLSFYFHR